MLLYIPKRNLISAVFVEKLSNAGAPLQITFESTQGIVHTSVRSVISTSLLLAISLFIGGHTVGRNHINVEHV
jgi:hypothetical protein